MQFGGALPRHHRIDLPASIRGHHRDRRTALSTPPSKNGGHRAGSRFLVNDRAHRRQCCFSRRRSEHRIGLMRPGGRRELVRRTVLSTPRPKKKRQTPSRISHSRARPSTSSPSPLWSPPPLWLRHQPPHPHHYQRPVTPGLLLSSPTPAPGAWPVSTQAAPTPSIASSHRRRRPQPPYQTCHRQRLSAFGESFHPTPTPTARAPCHLPPYSACCPRLALVSFASPPLMANSIASSPLSSPPTPASHTPRVATVPPLAVPTSPPATPAVYDAESRRRRPHRPRNWPAPRLQPHPGRTVP